MADTIRVIEVERGTCRIARASRPDLGPGHLRIRVAAAGVNRADLLQKSGAYPPPPGESPVLGLEVAGLVCEIGAEVVGWRDGDRAMALLPGGGYAEEVVVDARHVLPVPAERSWAEAAGFVEVFATAWLNLVLEAGATESKSPSVLLHAGASGVGTAAVQVCALLGQPCFATVGSAEKADFLISLGVSGVANRHDGPWLDAVLEWRASGVDRILDPVGADYLTANLRALATGGELVLIGLMGGRTAEIDLGRLLMRRITVRGSTLRHRPAALKAALLAELHERVVPAWRAGQVKTVIDQVFSWEDAESAHARMASNAGIGKLVLMVAPNL